jgi:hypothetical protein
VFPCSQFIASESKSPTHPNPRTTVAPPDVRAATAPHEARGSSGVHGRHELRVVMVARDILWSDAVWAPQVTTSLKFCVLNGILRWLPPPIHVMTSIIVFYAYHMHYLYKNWRILCLNTEFVHQFTGCHICCVHIEKEIPWFMLFVITIKNQIKSLMFVTARFLRL